MPQTPQLSDYGTILPVLILTLVFAAGSLWAEVPVNERRSVAPDALIEPEESDQGAASDGASEPDKETPA